MALPRLPRQPKPIHQTLPGDIQERTPPGQFVTEKFPVLTVGPTPEIDLTSWRLQVYGLVERELDLNWQEFIGLPPITVTADFHCVTQWSRLNNTWEGVAFTTLVNIVKPLTNACHVMVYCYGDYSVNIDLKSLMEDDVVLAYRHDGQDLDPDHGGPLRLVVPKRYGWKSAKWVHSLELIGEERLGFWEERGYHPRGDPWLEERYTME